MERKPNKSKIDLKLLGLGILLGIIIAVGLLFWIASLATKTNSNEANTIHVSMINTYYINSTGRPTFGGSIPGFNLSSGTTQFKTFDTNAGSTEYITSFQTNTTGFSVINISPTLPVKITGGQSQEFTLQIRTPDSNYSGALTIIGYTNSPKPVYVTVTQVNIFWHNVTENRTYFSAALNGFNSSANSYLYTFYISNSTATWLSFATNTTGFRILNVTPSLPYKITTKSQAFTIRIGVPNSSYSGPLTLIEQYR